MLKSKCIAILKTFSDSELDSFEEYISSPFLNKNYQIIKLFDLIKLYHPDYNDPSLSKEFLVKKFFNGKKYKEAYFRNLLSDLNTMAENFLSYQNYRAENGYYTHLIKELYSRDITKHFEEKVGSFEKLIEEMKYKSTTYHEDKIFLAEMRNNFNVNKSLTGETRSADIENKYNYFLIAIMESNCQFFIEQQRTNVNHDFSSLYHQLEYIQRDVSRFDNAPLVLIYYYACMSFLNDFEEESFIMFKRYFDEYKSKLSDMDKRNLYYLILTYYNGKSKEETWKFHRESLDIYIEMIDSKIAFLKSKHIDMIAARNILILCLNLNEKKFFSKFLKKIGEIIPEHSRDDLYLYANSLFNIMNKDYRKALVLLGKINFNNFLESIDDNVYYKADIKRYTLLCLYELGYLENALVQIDSYKHYLNYTRIIPKEMKNKNIEFLNILTELIKLKLRYDEFKGHLLRNKITRSKDLNLKTWLLEKLDEIKITIKVHKIT